MQNDKRQPRAVLWVCKPVTDKCEQAIKKLASSDIPHSVVETPIGVFPHGELPLLIVGDDERRGLDRIRDFIDRRLDPISRLLA